MIYFQLYIVNVGISIMYNILYCQKKLDYFLWCFTTYENEMLLGVNYYDKEQDYSHNITRPIENMGILAMGIYMKWMLCTINVY